MNIQSNKNFIYKAAVMNRLYKRIIMVCADAVALPLALWSGYALRLSEWWPEAYLGESWWLFIALPVVGVYIFARLGLYRAVVRFMGAQAIWAVLKGVMLLAVLLWAAATVFQIHPFPRSIPINFALAALVYVGGSRLLIRHYYHWLLKNYINKDSVIIYGAGGAGIQLATALSDGKEYYPVGFVDDDQSLWGATIKGLPVHNPSNIPELVASGNIKHILLAVPNVTNKQRKNILSKIEGYGVHVQMIPSMPELLSGEALITQLREVQIEDLLGRDSVPPKLSLLQKCITGQTVMVTGAGGSIGSELCLQVLSQNPKLLVLYEISEFNLYKIEQELRRVSIDKGLEVLIVALLGSVTDKVKVEKIISRFNIDTIYHAAAYKHVPIVEHNMVEGVRNNIFGTNIMANAAAKLNVSSFILVSTDKAVRPTNVMGATKRFSELILQQLSSGGSKTTFSMVRFGNVLGSSGSVVPLFREQIQAGGPLTVTHKDITRYFMTIPEAASLVIQAGSMAQGGDVFVLDMGEPVKVVDLARRMIQLSGLEVKSADDPEGDIEIQFTGLRPAEKLYEELLVGDSVIGTDHPKIMKANELFLSSEELQVYLSELEVASASYDCKLVKETLSKAVAGYSPAKELVDYMQQPNNVISLR